MTYQQLMAGALMLGMLGCAGTSGTGTAGTSTETASQEQAVAKNNAASEDDEGLICKRVKRTGTRISERICTTREQRRASAEASREAVNKIGVTATQIGGLPDGS